MNLPGYDEWKTRTPPEYEDEPEDPSFNDPDCCCNSEWDRHSRHKSCPIHGIDPDYEYDKWRDEQAERSDDY